MTLVDWAPVVGNIGTAVFAGLAVLWSVHAWRMSGPRPRVTIELTARTTQEADGSVSAGEPVYMITVLNVGREPCVVSEVPGVTLVGRQRLRIAEIVDQESVHYPRTLAPGSLARVTYPLDGIHEGVRMLEPLPARARGCTIVDGRFVTSRSISLEDLPEGGILALQHDLSGWRRTVKAWWWRIR